MMMRNRSASCTALDLMGGAVDVGPNDCVPSPSSVDAEEPVYDIRHSYVKSDSPTIVHQDTAHTLTPLSAELVTPDGTVLPAGVATYSFSLADSKASEMFRFAEDELLVSY